MSYDIIILIGFIVVAIVTWMRFVQHRFHYVDKNTRFCVVCGQKQVRYAAVHANAYVWFDSGRECDPNCHCHDYTNVEEGELS